MKNKTIDFDFKLKALHDDDDDEQGRFEGFGAKFFNVDRARDIIIPETFAKSLVIRKPALLWQHNSREPIGVFDEVSIKQDGLFVRGRLSSQGKGAEVHDLLRMGALNGLSVGFIPKDQETDSNGITTITEAELLEISLVTFPCNEEAIVTSVKHTPDFSDYSINYDIEFGSGIFNGADKKDHFIMSENDGKEEFSLAYAVNIENKTTAIWDAITMAAADVLARKRIDGKFDPELKDVIDHIEKYYDKAGKDSPFRKECGVVGIEEFDNMSHRQIEKTLINGCEFSKKAAKALVAAYRDDEQSTQRDAELLVEELNNLTKSIRSKPNG